MSIKLITYFELKKKQFWYKIIIIFCAAKGYKNGTLKRRLEYNIIKYKNKT